MERFGCVYTNRIDGDCPNEATVAVAYGFGTALAGSTQWTYRVCRDHVDWAKAGLPPGVWITETRVPSDVRIDLRPS